MGGAKKGQVEDEQCQNDDVEKDDADVRDHFHPTGDDEDEASHEYGAEEAGRRRDVSERLFEVEEFLTSTQALEDRKEDDAQEVDEASGGGDLLPQGAGEHGVDSCEAHGRAARRDCRQRQGRQQRHHEGECHDDDRHPESCISDDRIEAEEDDDAPHVLAGRHQDTLKHWKLLLATILAAVLFFREAAGNGARGA
eukprot:188315-Prymnesium_polylepis.1